MTLAARLEAIWYGPQRAGWPLRLLAALYGAVIAARRRLYRLGVLRSHRLAAPVVVVGNRVAGGTGKTPLVLTLVEHFLKQGYRPGVVSRGYGRRGQGADRAKQRPTGRGLRESGTGRQGVDRRRLRPDHRR